MFRYTCSDCGNDFDLRTDVTKGLVPWCPYCGGENTNRDDSKFAIIQFYESNEKDTWSQIEVVGFKVPPLVQTEDVLPKLVDIHFKDRYGCPNELEIVDGKYVYTWKHPTNPHTTTLELIEVKEITYEEFTLFEKYGLEKGLYGEIS